MSMTRAAEIADAERAYRAAGLPFAAAGAAQDTARRVAESEAPVVSVYLPLAEDGDGADPGAGRPLRWRAAAQELVADGLPLAAVDELSRRVNATPAARGMLALFTDARGKVLHRAIMRGEFRDPSAHFGAPARLRPLLAWEHRAMAHVVVGIDHSGADIAATIGRGAPAVLQTVGGFGTGEQSVDGAGGEPGEDREQRRVTEIPERLVADVARAVRAAADRCSAEVVLVAGEIRAVRMLEHDLAGRARWTIAELPGGRSGAGSHAARDREVNDVLVEADAVRSAWLLDRFTEMLAPTGRAVEGVDATLAALRSGRVEVLLVTDAPDERRGAWFGLRAADIYPDAATAAALSGGRARRQGPLADVAVRSALLSGARVRVVEGDHPQLPAEGVGAFCRWS